MTISNNSKEQHISMWTKIKDNTNVKVVAMAAAWSISIAVLYFSLCIMNPMQASGSFAAWGVIDPTNIRWSLMLRSFLVVNPFTAVGCMMGSMAFSAYQGKLLTGFYLITPFIYAAITFGAYKVSQKVGRSVIKDATIIFTTGFIIGIGTSINLSAIGLAAGLESAVWTLVIIDAIVAGLTTVLGYFVLVMPFEKVMRGVKNRKAQKEIEKQK